MGTSLSFPEPDLTDKVAVVTGGNAGIGYATAKGLARLGAHTFIACRSKEKAEEAIARMKEELSLSGGESSAAKEAENANDETVESGETEEVQSEAKASSSHKEIRLEFLPLDLSSFQSTVDCVKAFKERDLPLHILVNNAGIFAIPYRKTADGHETQFQVNHLGPLLLTLELLPILLATATSSGDGRIVSVSSALHFVASSFNAETLEPTEASYSRVGAYTTSKLYNVMMGFALQRKLPESSSITVSTADPGFVNTTANKGIADKRFLRFMHSIVASVAGRSPDKGAATSINAAVNPELNSQQHVYYDSCNPKQSSVDSRNEAFQEELWKRSLLMLKAYLSPEIWEKYGPKDEDLDIPPHQENQVPAEEDSIPNEETSESPPKQEDPVTKQEDSAAQEEGSAQEPANQTEDTPVVSQEEATAVPQESFESPGLKQDDEPEVEEAQNQ